MEQLSHEYDSMIRYSWLSTYEQKDEMKQKACEETRVEFVSLDEIKGLE